MITLVFFIIPIFLCSNAISWKKQRIQSELSGLAPSQIESLFLRAKYDHLESYSNKPDCFRRVANLIRTHCSELIMDEHARVQAAIQMTLCELATALHHSPPLECAPFLPSAVESSRFPHNPHGSQGNCVEALSRSAQFWSSYSGYLREVPQLCYAFRRWNDIDTAKDIYKNATREKLALIRFVLQREETALHNLRTSETHLEEMRDLANKMHSSKEAVIHEVTLHLSNGYDKTLELFKAAILTIQKQGEEDRSRFISQIDLALEQVLHDHSVALTALLPTLSTTFTSSLDELFTAIQEKNTGVLKLVNAVDQRWSSLSTHFLALQDSVSHLIQVTTDATDILSAHSTAAQSAHILHIESRHAATELVETISRLSSAAHTEIEWINRTGGESRERILKWERERERQVQAWGLWGLDVIKWLGVVWRLDPSGAEQMFHRPLFRICLFFAGLVRYIIQSAFSSMMGLLLVIVISSKKYFSSIVQYPTPHADSLSSDQQSLSLNRIIFPPATNPHLAATHHVPFHFSKSRTQNWTPSSCHHANTSPSHPFSRIPDRLWKPITSSC